MIAIVNISDNRNPFGRHTYSVRINKKEICQFEHMRENGLATCLVEAAKAVERQNWLDAVKQLEVKGEDRRD